MDDAPLLELDGLWKSFRGEAGTTHALRGASLSLAAGETVALTGESGSGKSTLLHLAGGLDAPDRGAVRLLGADLAGLGDAARAEARRSSVGIVFQQFNLIPSLDAADNVSFQARLAGRHDPAWCRELAGRLGLDGHLGKYPEQLSGGQQQRVAVARALAHRPPLVLADEPTGNLDEDTGDRVLDLMLELAAEAGAGLLLATHSGRLAARAGRRLRLSHGVVG